MWQDRQTQAQRLPSAFPCRLPGNLPFARSDRKMAFALYTQPARKKSNWERATWTLIGASISSNPLSMDWTDLASVFLRSGGCCLIGLRKNLARIWHGCQLIRAFRITPCFSTLTLRQVCTQRFLPDMDPPFCLLRWVLCSLSLRQREASGTCGLEVPCCPGLPFRR